MYNLTHCLIYHKILISMTVIKHRFYWIEMFYTSHFSSLNSLQEYFQHSVYSATKFGFQWLSFKTGLTVYKHYIIYIYLIPTHSVGSVCRQPSPTKREGPIRCPTPWFLPKKNKLSMEDQIISISHESFISISNQKNLWPEEPWFFNIFNFFLIN